MEILSKTMNRLKKVLEYLYVLTLILAGLAAAVIGTAHIIGIENLYHYNYIPKETSSLVLVMLGILTMAVGMERVVVFGSFDKRLEQVESLLARYYSNKEQQKGHIQISPERQKALTGYWEGNICQSNSPSGYDENPVTIEFDIKGNLIEGRGTVCTIPNNEKEKLIFSGRYHDNTIFELKYKNKDPKIIQHGLAILRLSADAKKINGIFLGYGHKTGNADGTISLDKTA